MAAAAAAQYQGGGEEDVYPAGAHAIGHGGVHGEGGEGGQAEGAPQMAKRTSDWVQEGEEEQDEAKKARIDGDPGAQSRCCCHTLSHCLMRKQMSLGLHCRDVVQACDTHLD